MSPRKLNTFITAAMFSAMLAGCAASGTVDTNNDAMMESSSAMMDSSEQAMMDHGNYANGTYTADGIYMSPAGEEHVGVTLTLTDGVVTDAQFEGKAENPGSVRMQQQFSEGFREVVVGKNIDMLDLSVVNGSSLTPKGFMDAVAKIKAEAQA